MDERAKRIGLNEAAFRHANERVQHVAESFSVVAQRTEFVCECGSRECNAPVPMTLDEYEHVRSAPTWFFVVPGHEVPDVERVVDRRDGYDIIEKLPGGPAGLAIREYGRRPDG